MSRTYIEQHFADIRKHAGEIEEEEIRPGD